MGEYTPTDAQLLRLGMPDDPHWRQEALNWWQYVSNHTSSPWVPRYLLVSL